MPQQSIVMDVVAGLNEGCQVPGDHTMKLSPFVLCTSDSGLVSGEDDDYEEGCIFEDIVFDDDNGVEFVSCSDAVAVRNKQTTKNDEQGSFSSPSWCSASSSSKKNGHDHGTPQEEQPPQPPPTKVSKENSGQRGASVLNKKSDHLPKEQQGEEHGFSHSSPPCCALEKKKQHVTTRISMRGQEQGGVEGRRVPEEAEAVLLKRSPSDVLFGRGQPNRDFPGNKHYRSIVLEYLDEYRCSKKSRKSRIILAVAQEIRNNDGRFLIPVDEKCSELGYRYALEKEIRSKISHAFRDAHKNGALATKAGGGPPRRTSKKSYHRKMKQIPR